jgi:hypothetical protein
MPSGNERAIYVWAESETEFIIGNIRYSGFPSVEDHGAVHDLEIEDDQGLLERTHVKFFTDGIVGVEFNYHGPRVSSLAAYLKKKCPTFPTSKFEPIINEEILQELNNYKEFRLLRFCMHRDERDLVAQALPSLSDALEATAQEWSAPFMLDILLLIDCHCARV